MTKKTINAKVDPALHEGLRKLSKENRRSMSVELTILVEKKLIEAGLWSRPEEEVVVQVAT